MEGSRIIEAWPKIYPSVAGQEARQVGESDGPVGEPPAIAPTTGPITNAEQIAKLENAISSMPEKLAEILRVRLIEEKSTAQAARQLGIAEVTVKKRLAQGRSLLERVLKQRRDESCTRE